MAFEQDELKLTVALDDQASAGLSNLQHQLQGIITAVAPAQAGLKQLGQSLRGIGGHAHAAHGSLGGLARGGFMAGFFFEVGRQVENMAKEFAEAVLDIKAYADTMVKLDQVSSRAAQSMGQFRANVAVFRESGVGQEQATKMLSGYADALASLQRPGNPIVRQLLQGQSGVYRERMEDLLRTIMTSSQTQGINAIRQAGRAIKEEHERRGQPERGAAAEASFYARLGMPGLENVRHELHEISAEEERMYNDRRKDAQSYQTSLEKQADAWHRSVESIQAIAFELLPIASGGELGAKTFTYFAEGVEALERAMRNTNTEIDKQRSEAARKRVVTPEGREITAQEGLSEDEQRKERLRRRFNPRRTSTTRTGETLSPAPDFSDLSETGDVKDVTGGASKPRRGRAGSNAPGYRRVNLLGGEVNTGGSESAGATVDPAILASIPSIGDLLKPDPANAIKVPVDPNDYAGTGWRGLPMSKNVIDLRGQSTELTYLEEQSERMGLLTTQVNQLNEYLAPELMRMLLAGTGAPDFHNAPQGGAAGESDPIQLPSGAQQPGGGGAAEARQPLLRPWRPGDPVTGTWGKGGTKKYPVLGPAATPLLPQAPGEKTYSGVSQGKGVASYYGYDPAYGVDPSDPKGSNRLRVPERYQGISLSTGKSGALGTSGQSLGQSHYVTDPNTGLTHVLQQTDVGPGVRTQKIVDIAAEKAIRLGYGSIREFEAQQGRVERGAVAPWEVSPTGFGTYGRPGVAGKDIDAPMVKNVDPTVTTQNIRELDTGKLIDPRLVGGQRGTTPGGIDMEYGGGSGGFDVGGLYEGGASRGELGASPTPSLLQGPQAGPMAPAPGAPGAPVATGPYTGPEEGAGKGFRLDAGGGSASLDDGGRIQLAKRDTARGERANSAAQDWLGEASSRQGRDDRLSSLDGSALDRAGSGVNVNQSGRLRVDVNAPAGTTVSAEGEGVFKQTETNRSVPMEANA